MRPAISFAPSASPVSEKSALPSRVRQNSVQAEARMVCAGRLRRESEAGPFSAAAARPAVEAPVVATTPAVAEPVVEDQQPRPGNRHPGTHRRRVHLRIRAEHILAIVHIGEDDRKGLRTGATFDLEGNGRSGQRSGSEIDIAR